MPMMKTAGYFCKTRVSRCFRGRSGYISRISSACRKVSSSAMSGYLLVFSLGNSFWTWFSAPLRTFQILRTTSFKNSRFRSLGVITRSQSH